MNPHPSSPQLNSENLGHAIERAGGGGLFERVSLFIFLVKFYDNFLPAQSNACKTTMYSNNFYTTLNVLRRSTIYFSTIQLNMFYDVRDLYEASCFFQK